MSAGTILDGVMAQVSLEIDLSPLVLEVALLVPVSPHHQAETTRDRQLAEALTIM